MFNNFSVTGCSLELLKIGEKGRIKFCTNQEERILNQVRSLGLYPGICITLEQRFPCFVIKVGHENLVIERDIARSIYVQVINS